jgi:hypothetical protein
MALMDSNKNMKPQLRDLLIVVGVIPIGFFLPFIHLGWVGAILIFTAILLTPYFAYKYFKSK